MQTANPPEPSQACLEAMSRSLALQKALDNVVDWDSMSDEQFEQAVEDFDRQAGLDKFSSEERDAAFWMLVDAASLTEQ